MQCLEHRWSKKILPQSTEAIAWGCVLMLCWYVFEIKCGEQIFDINNKNLHLKNRSSNAKSTKRQLGPTCWAIRSNLLSRVLDTLILPSLLYISTPPDLTRREKNQPQNKQKLGPEPGTAGIWAPPRCCLHVRGEEVVLVDADLQVVLHGGFVYGNVPLDGSLRGAYYI